MNFFPQKVKNIKEIASKIKYNVHFMPRIMHGKIA